MHSLQYADNFDLSRARAVAVAEVLKPHAADFGRVDGKGWVRPSRSYPLDTPENRARNRRVEIIHLRQLHGGLADDCAVEEALAVAPAGVCC